MRLARLHMTITMLVLAATGCSQTLRPEQAEQAEQLDAGTYLHAHLPAQPMVTVGEACRAMVMLAEGDDPYPDFAAREAALEERGILRPEWNLQRNECIDRGSVAYMVCQILQVRGGVNFNLFGRLGIGDRRYAVRELVYLDIMPPGAPYRYLAGSELLEIMSEADRYMARHGMYEAEVQDIEDMVEEQMQEASIEPAGGGP